MLTTSADDSVTTAEISVSLGLIVTELVINALKHAFPGPAQQGRITVEYTAHGKRWAPRSSRRCRASCTHR